MPLIVGSASDPHVLAVTAQMTSAATLIDAATILDGLVTLQDHALWISGQRVEPGPAWIRRLAPEGWAEGMSRPGVPGAERSASMSTLAAIARDERFAWLSDLDCFGSAENKPLQYRRAAMAGIPVPEWIVTTDPDTVPRSGDWVTKPLGPGSFIDDKSVGWVVPTTQLDMTTPPEVVARVPFILQRRVKVESHARVVTVEGSVFSATLPSQNLPLDWRMSAAGHYGFTTSPVPEHVEKMATIVAQTMRVGYSAQDWVLDDSGGWWFIDLNPAGQWLFLPSEVSAAVTRCIAGFLDRDRDQK